MKFLFTAVILFCIPSLLFSQNITVEPVPEHSGYNTRTFPAADGSVTVSGNQFVLGSTEVFNPIAWSFSESRKKAAFLDNRGGVMLTSYTSDGETLINKSLDFFTASDNTMNAYQFEDGRIVLRDNVANFSFLNSKGTIAYSQSNSSGSTEGEKESELAANPSGSTIVLYNPVIAYNGQTGSQAQIVYGEQDVIPFFSSRSEEIKSVDVSKDGSIVTLITTGGNNERVLLFDRFGSELFQVETTEDLVGTTLHPEATYITLYSSGRVQVYEIPGGELLGSASSRASVLFADYDPVTQTIVALGGTLESQVIEEPEIMAVSISQREIIREDIPFSLSLLNLDRVGMTKTGTQSYEISGLNRHLRIGIQF